jgi:hypothetical protein
MKMNTNLHLVPWLRILEICVARCLTKHRDLMPNTRGISSFDHILILLYAYLLREFLEYICMYIYIYIYNVVI